MFNCPAVLHVFAFCNINAQAKKLYIMLYKYKLGCSYFAFTLRLLSPRVARK